MRSFKKKLRNKYSEQLFLPPITALVKKSWKFINLIHIYEKLHLFGISDVSFKNVYFLLTC